MTDPTKGQPGGDPERRLPARRPPTEPPSRSPERFTAPRQTRAIAGLTPERAAKIVRQSGDARWVAFLGVAIVALFVIVYYFYELGVPFFDAKARLDVEVDQQQVTAITRGYNLYEANCARCHGVNGEGGIGPVLNDQMKLFSHLNEQYLKNVLTAGGRYVCGNPKSQMPVWADTNGGPLNYIAIDDLIAFLRAPNNQEFIRRDPELNEPVLDADGKVVTFKGWRDPDFKPDPAATPVPDCYLGDNGGATQGPPPSIGPETTILELNAVSPVSYDKTELTAPAGEVFVIKFDNTETGLEHDVDIRVSPTGETLQNQAPVLAPTLIDYAYQPLEAGTYTFICSIHPIPSMTGTLTVE